MKYINFLLLQIQILFCDLFKGVTRGTGENMRSGELVVIGKNKVEIELIHNKPRKIIVEFIDDCVVTPCNPKHCDVWCWEIRPRHGYKNCHFLHLHWHVAGVRTIRWTILY